MSRKRGISVLAVVITAVLGIFVMQRTLAATGKLFLSPASVSVQKGKTFTVDVRINPSTPTDGVEANIAYDASKLQFVSINVSGTAYPSELLNSGGGGTVQIARGKLGGTVSANNSLVAKVSFKALAGSGSTSLDLTGNSTSGGSYNDPTLAGATVSFSTPTTPTPTPTPKPTPKPTPTTTPKPSTSTPQPSTSTGGSDDSDDHDDTTNTSTPKPTTPPKTSAGVEVSVIKTSFREIDFRLKGPKPFTAYIKYGIEGQLNIVTPTTKLAKAHVIQLDEKLMIPGTTYSYVVVTKDQSGKTTETEEAAVKTEGYTVRITVSGKGGKPLKNQLVTLHSEPMNARTDEEGMVTFEDVSPGKHELAYSQDGTTMKQTIEVADNATTMGGEVHADPQTFAVTFEEASTGSPWAMIIALVGVLAVIGAGILLFRSGKLSGGSTRFGGPSGGVNAGGGNTIVGSGTPTGGSSSTDELLSKVPGEHNADPGSVISPNGEEQK